MRLSWLLIPLLFMNALQGGAMDAAEMRHLLSRTGFGVAEPEAIGAIKGLTHDQAVDHLLAGIRQEPVTAPPDWVREPLADRRQMRMETAGLSEEERRKRFMERQRLNRRRGAELKAWWYGEMLATDSPLTEKMVLVWHNHFTSSLQKVRAPQLMHRQNALLRRNALGNFGALLHAVARDPAMLIYLDNVTNRRSAPNENFARELLELFTLGEGHYTERDIKEAARAFTGWQVDRRSASFRINPRQHDSDAKVFMNRRGSLEGNDIIEIVLEQPRTAVYITEKLWREFISDQPDPAEVERLAGIFRENNYELKPLMRAMLTSDHFRRAENHGALIKSPTELLVGTARLFDVSVENPYSLVVFGRRLGQDLLNPPNVKGWPGGTHWINSNSLLVRREFIERLVAGEGPNPQAVEMWRMMRDGAQAEMAMDGGGDSPSSGKGRNPRRKLNPQRMERIAMHMAPQADLDAWLAGLPENTTDPKILQWLLLALPPTTAASPMRPFDQRVAALLLDPVYQLK